MRLEVQEVRDTSKYVIFQYNVIDAGTQMGARHSMCAGDGCPEQRSVCLACLPYLLLKPQLLLCAYS